MKQEWNIADVTVKPDSRLEAYISIEGTDESMPVTFINGEHEGKTVLISSGLHGGEYEGIRAATELAKELNPSDIHGQLAIVHPCSVQVFKAKQECITPDDGKNLNRVFPPDKNGTLTDKIAWTLWDKLQQHCDFHMDLHGCFSEFLNPHVYYTGIASDDVVAEARAAAEVVGVPFMVRSNVTNEFYAHGGVNGIPGLLIERGDTNLIMKDEINQYKTDLRNVLRHLGVLTSEMELQTIKPVDVQEVHYDLAAQSGCWYPEVDVFTPLKKGDLIGEIKDFFGNVLETIYAQYDGIPLYMYGMMPVNKGDLLICYAKDIK